MNVFDVEVLSSYDESTASYSSVERKPGRSHLVDAQGIVTCRLLKRVNGIEFVGIRWHRSSTSAHLRLQLGGFAGCFKPIMDFHLRIASYFSLLELLLLKISQTEVVLMAFVCNLAWRSFAHKFYLLLRSGLPFHLAELASRVDVGALTLIPLNELLLLSLVFVVI